MSITEDALNNSPWREDWNLKGGLLTHVSGLTFTIENQGEQINVVANPEPLMEFQRKLMAAGKTQDQIMHAIKLISEQIQPFNYEATTGRQTSFKSIH